MHDDDARLRAAGGGFDQFDRPRQRRDYLIPFPRMALPQGCWIEARLPPPADGPFSCWAKTDPKSIGYNRTMGRCGTAHAAEAV